MSEDNGVRAAERAEVARPEATDPLAGMTRKQKAIAEIWLRLGSDAMLKDVQADARLAGLSVSITTIIKVRRRLFPDYIPQNGRAPARVRQEAPDLGDVAQLLRTARELKAVANRFGGVARLRALLGLLEQLKD